MESAYTILNSASLAATLWNLEEARLAGGSPDHPVVAVALDWLVTRQGMPGAYRNLLFAPADNDWAALQLTPTGEDMGASRASMMHILGEEATRALLLWGRTEGWNNDATVAAIYRRFEPEGAPTSNRVDHFCCGRCSVARWRALAAGKPPGWEALLLAVVNRLRYEPMERDRWRGLPFYYTLLTLSEFPAIEGLESVRERIAPTAARALVRLTETGIAARFRRRALEWALG